MQTGSLPEDLLRNSFAGAVPPAESCNRFYNLPPALDWIAYAGIVACSLATALIGAIYVNADTVAYLDLSDAVLFHHWHALINASWFPLYPAFLALGKASFADRPQYEFMATRLVDALLGLFFVLASVVLAGSIRRLMLARGVHAGLLLPPRTLYLWTAIFAYFFSLDLTGINPDSLVSSFMLLAVAAILWGIADDTVLPYLIAGLCGALAYWTKAFAFPVFLLWISLAGFVNLRKFRVIGRLLLALTVFALFAFPYIWQISASKGRFTIGDSGILNTAWYVNGADRFNPIDDFAIYGRGTATANFKHPGELLAANPEITYYGGDQVLGTTPQWDDFSYWSDGLKSHFVPRQTAAAVQVNLAALGLILPMRIQALFLIAALFIWAFHIRRASFADPILRMVILLAVGSIVSILLVHFEFRYVAFAFVIFGTVYAASSVAQRPAANHRSLHSCVLLITGLILLYSFQNSAREFKQATQQGAHPLQGVYNSQVISAGSQIASLYPRGSEVACMGDAACWDDTYWAKYGGVKMTAIIETGKGYFSESTSEGCARVQQNPAALDPLRKKHVRAIIAEFGDTPPCSAQWLPLGSSGHYFYLPI